MQSKNKEIFIGKGREDRNLALDRFTRHGLIAGATGTGKTVTLRLLAEALSNEGVPVFLADVKGDLSGLAVHGEVTVKISERLKLINRDSFLPRASPVIFWDLYQEKGHPIRTTISEMGPILLTRLLNLNETQSGVLQIAFRVADEQGLLLVDIKDLRAILQYLGENSNEIALTYGNVSTATVGAIQRAILTLEEHGGDLFFGEPALKIEDFFRFDTNGRGYIQILSAERLMQTPKLYGTFLLWFLSELFEQLPEVGDIEKPKLVFFFDEAHLLFDDINNALVEKIEQIVRLIRSKGVGVFFVTQNPLDIPEKILAQLGNRFQHAMRAFTPRDKKNVSAIAQTFRDSEDFSVDEAIMELAIGEALVSVLDSEGVPTPVDRVFIDVPATRLGTLTDAEREKMIEQSILSGVYDRLVDRDSAYELLKARREGGNTSTNLQNDDIVKEAEKKPRSKATPLDAFVSSAARSVGNQLGRQIFRGILGVILGKK